MFRVPLLSYLGIPYCDPPEELKMVFKLNQNSSDLAIQSLIAFLS